jgi:3-phosphoshikimate 1-carboxyvinyltransferase
VRHSQLQACEIGGSLIPRLIDEIPILAVAAIFAKGTTTIRDAAELRVKESDRLMAMATQLNRLGAKITELPDGLEIVGGTPLVGTDVDSYGDHRVAMSLAIAALNANGTTTIQGAEAAAISYPEFTATLQQVLS